MFSILLQTRWKYKLHLVYLQLLYLTNYKVSHLFILGLEVNRKVDLKKVLPSQYLEELLQFLPNQRTRRKLRFFYCEQVMIFLYLFSKNTSLKISKMLTKWV